MKKEKERKHIDPIEKIETRLIDCTTADSNLCCLIEVVLHYTFCATVPPEQFKTVSHAVSIRDWYHISPTLRKQKNLVLSFSG